MCWLLWKNYQRLHKNILQRLESSKVQRNIIQTIIFIEQNFFKVKYLF